MKNYLKFKIIWVWVLNDAISSIQNNLFLASEFSAAYMLEEAMMHFFDKMA